MTSEGTHHPGQQPEEASPGAGGPTPYGDRPAKQDDGYAPGQPDLGWAPPPPPQPTPAGPAWSAEAPPTAAWGTARPPEQDPAATSAAWAREPGTPPWPAQQEQPGPSSPPEAPAWAPPQSPTAAWT
ncbi:hypothetical protein HCB18_26585, partial [Salinispora arenicola]|nr:hypothetical protein [Salinispora arenicola]